MQTHTHTRIQTFVDRSNSKKPGVHRPAHVPGLKILRSIQCLGCITNIQHRINIKYIDQSHRPVVHSPQHVPVKLRSKLQEELKRMEQLNVIEKVGDPTDWVNSMVTFIKPSGKLRICIDPCDLNRAIKREYYPTRTIEEVVTSIPNAKVFSVLDASSGFWQIELDPDSTKLCTFNTLFGRCMFKHLPFGLTCSQDTFQRLMSDMLEDIEGVEIVVDDIRTCLGRER